MGWAEGWDGMGWAGLGLTKWGGPLICMAKSPISLISAYLQTQMDINVLDQPEKDFKETNLEHSVDCPDSSDIFGESESLPRVGDEYQAAMPNMLSPSELHSYFSSQYNSQPSNKEEIAIIDEAIQVNDDIDSSRTESKQCSALDKKESNVKGDCSDQRRVNNDYSDFPGLPTESWSEFEVDSFLLGLYVFGKNLLQVKRFMGSKEMGDLLSFYYGRFFGSDKYGQWADCRKTKGRKCIIGQRLLMGNKQQELFSRLLPRLSEESRNTSLEAYKAFADGRSSVEEYISTLKNMVGIHALVDAVAIGKINKDLTLMAMEPSRTSHMHPSAKDYCSLTYEEIIKYLSGDLRLSKARSSDLFWDAVWPRLLAKGWHSEKPKDEFFRSSRNFLVFLLPGIEKYRRKLLKGVQYFDSVSDVLKKVASEPKTLLLEDEEIGAVRCCGDKNGSDDDHNHDLSEKVRDIVVYSHPKGQANGGGKKRIASSNYDPPQKPVKKQSDNLSADKQVSPLKNNVLHRLTYTQQECIDPVVKRRKLTAAMARQDTCVLSLPVTSKKSVQKSHSPAHTCIDVSPTSSLIADYHGGSCSSAISSQSYSKSDLLMIDLNVPQAPAETEVNGMVINVKAEDSNDSSQNDSHDSPETVVGSSVDCICSDEQANGNARRQSTRIRPMSTRALEALESSLSKPKAKKRSSADFQDEKSRASRRSRSKTIPGNCTVDAVRDSETVRPNGILHAMQVIFSRSSMHRSNKLRFNCGAAEMALHYSATTNSSSRRHFSILLSGDQKESLPSEQFRPLVSAFQRRFLVGLGSASLVAFGANFAGITSLVLGTSPEFARSLKLDVLYPVNGYNRYFQTNEGFEFIYPANWAGDQTLLYRAAEKLAQQRTLDLIPSDSKPANQRRRNVNEPVVAFGPPGSTGELNVSVVVSPVPLDFRIEAFGGAEEVGEAILRTITGRGRSDLKATLLRAAVRRDPEKEVSYYELEFKVESPTFRRHNVAVCCARGRRLYTLNAQAPESSWPEVKTDFYAISDSFNLTSLPQDF
ncbi:hypothetical protein V2J09_023547 [Rumex salicifolius]